jgi:very-short-patch-repair endonuclease
VPAASRATDPGLKDRVGRLVQFLKDLVTARSVPVRTIEGHLGHLWLGDIRDLASIEPEAGPGEVLLRLPRVFLEPPPDLPAALHGWVRVTDRDNSSLTAPPLREAIVRPDGATAERADRPDVLQAYEAWLPHWQRWAEADRPKRRLHVTYDRLRDMRQRMLENPETVEAVVAGGLLQLPREGVRTHVVSRRVTIDIEAGSGDILVVLDTEAVTGLDDNRVLAGMSCFDDGGTSVLRSRIAELDVRPSNDSAVTFLKEWAQRAVLQPVDVLADWAVPANDRAVVSHTPAVVLRQRGAYALVEYYTRIEWALGEPGMAVPLGLAQLVEAIDAEDRVSWLEETGAAAGAHVADDPLFPLPANEEQSQIIGRLRGDTGVVVEGPPGTGKTHTIANLMSALLARGQRVLVTSEKAQALKVLRDKLPDGIQELCVSITDAGRGGSLELARSVSTLATEHSSFNPSRSRRLIEDLAGKLDQARNRRTAVLDSIRALRESETYEHAEIAPEYGGTLARIAEAVATSAPRFSWMPLPASGPLPLTALELQELRRELPGDTELRRRRRDQRIPTPDSLPDPRLVERLAKDVQRGTEARTRRPGPLSDVLAEVDAPTLAGLIEICRTLHDGLAALSVGADAAWAMPLLDSVLRGDDEVLWAQVRGARQLVHDALGMNDQIGYRLVDVTTEMPAPLAGTVFGDLARYLGNGGTLKKLFKSDEQKAAEPYLAAVQVDGQPIRTAEQAHVAFLHFASLARLQSFAGQTAFLGIPVAFAGPRAAQVSVAHRVVKTMESIDVLRQRRDDLGRALAAVPAMPRVDLFTTQGVRTFVDMATVFADVEVARRADDQLRQLAAAAESQVRPAQRPPELSRLVEALRNADAASYAQRVAELETAHREQRAQRRCDELSERLGSRSGQLLARLRDSATDEVWEERLPQVEDAWAWACAATFVRDRTAPGQEAALDRDLAAVDRDIARLTAELAAAHAWKSCLERMNASQVTALQAYRDNMANVGKGTGKYAQRYRLAARDAMRAAQQAVPAWVMPLQEVLASIPPQQNAFDVVIVDEASQVGIENLFLLWLAPRVIVVGDDKQCTPSEVKHGALDRVFDRLDTLLPDMPSYMRATLTPRSSVFSTMRTRFGQVIRLREHFRCMPEIIAWSSQMFYRDAPLIPVRQHGADRLDPLRTTFVPSAYTEGAYGSLRNVVEAEAVVETLVSCLQDPGYDGKTFGVVVLQGRAQVDVIRDALFRRVDPDEWEARKIRVGTPPDFQGDERDVVLLSLVTAPDHKRMAQTRLDAQRAYNVAASRARDQLWLFHSVTTDQLRLDDLRSQLLTYMSAIPVSAAAPMPTGVSEDERHPDFDSLFEQRVFLRIQQRGYHVTPQAEINGRRIDLVITGSEGQLAVGCDGDTWHSTPEQAASDFARELELRRCGWQFWRVRESRFRLDPEAALADLWLTLDKRGIHPARIDPSGPQGNWVPGPLSIEEGQDDTYFDGTTDSALVVAGSRPHSRPIDTPPAQQHTAPSGPAASADGVPPRAGSDLLPPPSGHRTAEDSPAGAHPRAADVGHVNPVDDETRMLVLELAADGALTNEIVRQFLGVGSEQARYVLTALTNEGLLERRGATKGTHYVLAATWLGSSGPSNAAENVHRPPVRPQRALGHDHMVEVVLQMAERGPLTNEMVRDFLAIGREDARRLLTRLSQDGRLQLRGVGRGAHYVLSKPPSRDAVTEQAPRRDASPSRENDHNAPPPTPPSPSAPSAQVPFSADRHRDSTPKKRPPSRSADSQNGTGHGQGSSERTLAALKVDFNRRLQRDLWEVLRRSDYRPIYYQRMLAEDGGWMTARKLMAETKVHDGLTRLWELGLLTYSLEAAVLDPAYAELFSSRELDTARRRLADLGYSTGT